MPPPTTAAASPWAARAAVGPSQTAGEHSRLVIHVDGGSRGNPGPAAIGVVLSDPDGTMVEELGERIGVATNNVAEYRALLRGVQHAAELGAREVELINDSELVAKQLTGAYKVKHPSMQPLHAEAIAALNGFESWRIRSVPRAQNARADALVNEALDGLR
jgi:ribonuclease HI